MDKKLKQHRHKQLTEEEASEITEITPPGASFDTEAGRAAQGMRPDIGKGQSDEERKRDERHPAPPPPDARADRGKEGDADDEATHDDHVT